jgi:hypothetical protein
MSLLSLFIIFLIFLIHNYDYKFFFFQNDSRLKFVKLGGFARVIDYIRGTEDLPEIQSLGLLVLRNLVSSDQALKQLFLAHGGMSLVMALHEYKEGLVKEEAAYTLKTFSKGNSTIHESKLYSVSYFNTCKILL